MDDLAGLGKAAEKFLSLIQDSIGTLYRPKAIRKEGRASAEAEAYRIVAMARANAVAAQIAADSEEALAQRAALRLRHEEMRKQENIEAIIDQTISKLEGEAVEDDVDRDWISYFFESCAGVSDAKIQELWSNILASKVTGNERLPRKVIDCLRWLDAEGAQQFKGFAPYAFLFGGAFSVGLELDRDDNVRHIAFPYDCEALAEIGLVKENLNKTFWLSFASLAITCRELSDRSLAYRNFYELSQSGRALAAAVIPSIHALLSVRQVSDELYSEKEFEHENAIVPAIDRIRAVCGGILYCLLEADVEIVVAKGVVRIEGDQRYHDEGKVMSVSTAGAKLQIKYFKRTRYWKALSKFEREFLDTFASLLTEHAQWLERRPRRE
ncbi:DUF2806 domain-containing protein [Bradyrhizobium liaoningense]|uniref:DUF2806 domain-containing protein n=1 Tax=Bradyrhizobium liaoningense TaxID=43992 RepID=UPI001BAC17E4|nr:DUF2806 domain-containing protein [Bradyrhizobium liaoningense]